MRENDMSGMGPYALVPNMLACAGIKTPGNKGEIPEGQRHDAVAKESLAAYRRLPSATKNCGRNLGDASVFANDSRDPHVCCF